MSEIKDKLAASALQLTSPGAPWEVEEKNFNGINYKIYKNAPATLKALIDVGRAHGDKEFIIYENERISFTEFFARADALANQFVHEFNIQPGDRVAIAMRNYPEWLIAFVAAVYAGAVAVPLNSWGQRAEIIYGIKDSGAKLIVLDQQRYEHIAEDIPKMNISAIVARPDRELCPFTCQTFDSVIKTGLGKPTLAIETDPESTALIMYTSGTTGDPKGAASNQRNICQAVYNFEFAGTCAAMSDSGPIIKMMERGFPPKVLLALPLFHVSGCHSVFLLSLRSGRPIVMMHKWDKVKALELVEKERITMISAVPTMLMDMLDAEEWSQYDTSSIFGFGAGGSAQPPRLSSLIYTKLPDSFPGTGYGMTETSATGFSITGAAYAYKPKSAGIASPIVEARIVDEKGNTVATGVHGEIHLKTPGVIQAYWNKPEATAETFHNGWLMTGDIGYLDDEGFLFITDRIKDMVIRGGENIYSVEVEGAILTHEGILEVAAFGIPNEKLGEELAVAVVLKSGVTLTANDIQQHVAQHLAKFKVPTYVFFEDDLLKNATLKVIKKPLKEKYNKIVNA